MAKARRSSSRGSPAARGTVSAWPAGRPRRRSRRPGPSPLVEFISAARDRHSMPSTHRGRRWPEPRGPRGAGPGPSPRAGPRGGAAPRGSGQPARGRSPSPRRRRGPSRLPALCPLSRGDRRARPADLDQRLCEQTSAPTTEITGTNQQGGTAVGEQQHHDHDAATASKQQRGVDALEGLGDVGRRFRRAR